MRATLKVEGMTCVNCARTIEIALRKREGIRDVRVSFELGRVEVDFDESRVTEEEIARVIEDLGYRVLEEESRNDIYVLLFSAVSSLLILLLMFYRIPDGMLIQFLLSTAVQLIGGWKFYTGAYSTLRNGVAGMDVLVALGTSGAYLYSCLVFAGLLPGDPFFETNAFLITFVRGGRFIEERAKKRALKLLKELLSTQHSEVTVLSAEGEIRKNVREVFRDEIVLYRTGDMILLDGTVVEGSAYVSEAVLTGEPEPIPKKPGDTVVSGSVVEDGYLKVRVTATYEGSYLSKIGRMIDRALAEKPRIQRLADRISHYFVQAVVVIAALTFLLWLKASGDLQKAVQFSLAVLVISCPCALGIATPLAVVVGISRALRAGILIKRPPAIEVFPKVDLVIFDKTGTLTEGRFQVVECDLKSDTALDIALSLESRSNHPIARAIREFARSRGAREIPLADCREIAGRGVQCGEYFIGDAGEERTASDHVTKRIALRKGDELLAVFHLRDTLRKEARAVVSAVKALGLKPVLLSGDRESATRSVAQELGFEEFIAEVSPEDKKRVVEEFQRKGHVVAMVGDGINDAPALAQADLSFAVPHGVDITKQVGDVILLSGIRSLPYAFSLCREVNAKIKQNLGWAFVYNVVGIPIAGGALYKFGVYLKPEIAGLMMALSSLSVVANTLLLHRRSEL